MLQWEVWEGSRAGLSKGGAQRQPAGAQGAWGRRGVDGGGGGSWQVGAGWRCRSAAACMLPPPLLSRATRLLSASHLMPAPPAAQPPRLVVAFVIGGTTYEEAKAVAELNAAGERGEGWSAGVRLLLGGTSVQSSTSFLKDFQEVMVNERYAQ